MIVKMFQCDNPTCEVYGSPQDLDQRRRLIMPYGWYKIQVYQEGNGKLGEIVACSDKCAAAALIELETPQ